ncbi:MAG: hypothetical protein EWM73_03736 [Nitrospira sp.]|nr:MAG: hypothetical protein EWM73_03736 [Nitrospira sp.]
MTCGRCDGLMVDERICDWEVTEGDRCTDGYRCLLCGNIVDAVIAGNRRLTTDPSGSRVSRPRLPGPLSQPDWRRRAGSEVTNTADGLATF